MRRAVVSGGRMLLLANRARYNPSLASPFALWRLADQEACHRVEERCARYRHALIHAGLLGEAGACTVCGEELTPA